MQHKSVSPVPENDPANASEPMEPLQSENQIEVGGIYCSQQEDGKYMVFKVLALDPWAYHIAIYEEQFDEPPTLEQINNLEPYIGHAPMSRGGWRMHPAEKIAEITITDADLEGYYYYLYADDTNGPEFEEND